MLRGQDICGRPATAWGGMGCYFHEGYWGPVWCLHVRNIMDSASDFGHGYSGVGNAITLLHRSVTRKLTPGVGG